MWLNRKCLRSWWKLKMHLIFIGLCITWLDLSTPKMVVRTTKSDHWFLPHSSQLSETPTQSKWIPCFPVLGKYWKRYIITFKKIGYASPITKYCFCRINSSHDWRQWWVNASRENRSIKKKVRSTFQCQSMTNIHLFLSFESDICD